MDDPHDVGLALGCPAALKPFNQAGVLLPSDIHVATTLVRLGDESRDDVLLGAALAVRATRVGHVCADLAAMEKTLPNGDESELVLPELGSWVRALAASSLTATNDSARPLRLVDKRLYLERYWEYEQTVIAQIRARIATTPIDVDTTVLDKSLDRLFGLMNNNRLQRTAASTAVRNRFSVIAGGPGTGKTTTLASVIAALVDQARERGDPLPRIALTAPTGKAAARVNASLIEAVENIDAAPDVHELLQSLQAATIHRLLGRAYGSSSRFLHDRDRPLPHDVCIVDETSMVSLALMAGLMEAVRPDARIVLVGDPDQLFSVDAGAVLGDIVGPAADGSDMTEVINVTGAEESGLRGNIVVLRTMHRFSATSGIAALAEVIRAGDADATIATLSAGGDDLSWLPEVGESDTSWSECRKQVVDTGTAVFEAALEGDAPRALTAMTAHQVLCPHRRGPAGTSDWIERIEAWLRRAIDGYDTRDRWYVGRPVIITENDYQLGLFNGDTGVVIDTPQGRQAAFDTAEGIRLVPPVRLGATETAHALTIHKSQGSQFDQITVILPQEDSPILTRELLYTAVTRAGGHVRVAGSEAVVRVTVERQVQRASGLRAALWGEPLATPKASRDSAEQQSGTSGV